MIGILHKYYCLIIVSLAYGRFIIKWEYFDWYTSYILLFKGAISEFAKLHP